MSKKGNRFKKEIPLSQIVSLDIDNNETLIANKLMFTYDTYQETDFKWLRSILSDREYKVIIFLYYHKLQVKEISLHFNVSESAISQNKKSALNKIKKFYLESR